MSPEIPRTYSASHALYFSVFTSILSCRLLSVCRDGRRSRSGGDEGDRDPSGPNVRVVMARIEAPIHAASNQTLAVASAKSSPGRQERDHRRQRNRAREPIRNPRTGKGSFFRQRALATLAEALIRHDEDCSY